MARFPASPTADSLGARPQPGVTRGLFTYQPTPLPDPGPAYASLSKGLKETGENVREIGDLVGVSDAVTALYGGLVDAANVAKGDSASPSAGSEGQDNAPTRTPASPANALKTFESKASRSWQEAVRGLSPRQTEMFRGIVEPHYRRIHDDVAKHAAGRLLQQDSATFGKRLDQALVSLAKASSISERVAIIDAARAQIEARRQAGLLNDDEAATLRKTWASRHAYAQLDGFSTDDQLAALHATDPEGGAPAGPPRNAAEEFAVLLSPEQRRSATFRAETRQAENATRDRAALRQDTAAALNAVRTTGATDAVAPVSARIQAAQGDDAAADFRHQAEVRRAGFEFQKRATFATPQDMADMLERERPLSDPANRFGAASAKVGDAAAAQDIFAAKQAEAETIKARRAADPAGYAMQHPAVRAAFNEALGDGGLAGALSGGDGAKLQRAIALRQSLQDAMGIAPADRRLLTNDERREMIALLDQAAPEQKPVLLRQLRQALGAQTDDAIAEMADDGLGGGMELVARIADHPALAAEAAKAMATQHAELVRGIEPEKVKALDTRLSERLGPWRAAIEKQPGGRQRAAQQSALVRAVALNHLAKTADPKNSADSASNVLIYDRSAVTDIGLIVFTNIKGQSANLTRIAVGAQNQMEKVTKGVPREANVVLEPRGDSISLTTPKTGAEAVNVLKRALEYGKKQGWGLATELLEKFLSRGTQETEENSKNDDIPDAFSEPESAYIIDSWKIRKFNTIQGAEEINRQRFAEALLRPNKNISLDHYYLLRNLEDGKTIQLPPDEWQAVIPNWKAWLTDGMEFLLAGGTSTVTSRASKGLEETRKGDEIRVKGTITHIWDDTYDFKNKWWRPGVPTLNTLTKAAMLAERTGNAKSFDVQSTWSQEVNITMNILDNGELAFKRIQWTEFP